MKVPLNDLKRQYAAAIDASAPAYEVLFRDYEPWVSLGETRKNLARLRDGLKPLIEKAAAAKGWIERADGTLPAVDAAIAAVVRDFTVVALRG